MELPSIRLRWAPLAIGLIAVTTVVPLELRIAQRWTTDFNLVDVLQNLLLFVPLGISLSRRPSHTILVAAFATSMTVETAQIWQFDRFPSIYDVAANVLGAFASARAARRYWKQPLCFLPYGHAVVPVAIVAALATLVVWRLPTQPSRIVDWDPEFSLLIGNEVTGDRPWVGTTRELRIWSTELGRQQVHAFDPADPRLQTSLLYIDSKQYESLGGPPRALPAPAGAHIVDAVTNTGKLSIAVTLVPKHTNQHGPARIVTFSRDPFSRNFDLGQEEDRIVFRVRTPVSGPNGQATRAETDAALEAGRSARVIATYDGGIARIYVDGKPRARANLAAAGCSIAAACDSALPSMWALLGAAIAVVILAVRRHWTVTQRAIVSIMASAIPVGAQHWIGLMPDGIQPPAWVPMCALLGSVAVALAYAPPSREERISAA